MCYYVNILINITIIGGLKTEPSRASAITVIIIKQKAIYFKT